MPICKEGKTNAQNPGALEVKGAEQMEHTCGTWEVMCQQYLCSPPCRNLALLAAQLSYGTLQRRSWLPSLTAPAENPPASATGAAEHGLGVAGSSGVGGWCCAAGNSVCCMAWEGKALTWELAAPKLHKLELQLGDMMCWSSSAPGLQEDWEQKRGSAFQPFLGPCKSQMCKKSPCGTQIAAGA